MSCKRARWRAPEIGEHCRAATPVHTQSRGSTALHPIPAERRPTASHLSRGSRHPRLVSSCSVWVLPEPIRLAASRQRPERSTPRRDRRSAVARPAAHSRRHRFVSPVPKSPAPGCSTPEASRRRRHRVKRHSIAMASPPREVRPVRPASARPPAPARETSSSQSETAVEPGRVARLDPNPGPLRNHATSSAGVVLSLRRQRAPHAAFARASPRDSRSPRRALPPSAGTTASHRFAGRSVRRRDSIRRAPRARPRWSQSPRRHRVRPGPVQTGRLRHARFPRPGSGKRPELTSRLARLSARRPVTGTSVDQVLSPAHRSWGQPSREQPSLW